MNQPQTQPAAPETSQATLPTQANEFPPELVRLIADRVYAALQRDLQIERERARPAAPARMRGVRRQP